MTTIAPLNPEMAALLESLKDEAAAPVAIQDGILQRLDQTLTLPPSMSTPDGAPPDNNVPDSSALDSAAQPLGEGASGLLHGAAGSSGAATAVVQSVFLAKPFLLAVVAAVSVAAGTVWWSGRAPSLEKAAPAVRQPALRPQVQEPQVQEPQVQELQVQELHVQELQSEESQVQELQETDKPEPSVVRPPKTPKAKWPRSKAEVEASQLAQERLLLQAAHRAYTAGRPNTAKQKLAQHRQRFASGQLAEERDALTILLLADSGDQETAQKRYKSFLQRYPSSIFAEAIKAALERKSGDR